VSDATAIETPLCTRREQGGTAVLEDWGINSEYGVLRDVLLGSPDAFRWLGEENAQYSALVRDTLRRGYRFDRDLALRQHAEMVDAYRQAGVAAHLLDASEEQPYGVYARDSNFMTPFGAVVTQLANPRRRGEYANVLRFYLSRDIPVYDLVSAGNFEGGDFNMIAPGCVLIGYTGLRGEEVAARQVGGWMEDEGIEVRDAPIATEFRDLTPPAFAVAGITAPETAPEPAPPAPAAEATVLPPAEPPMYCSGLSSAIAAWNRSPL